MNSNWHPAPPQVRSEAARRLELLAPPDDKTAVNLLTDLAKDAAQRPRAPDMQPARGELSSPRGPVRRPRPLSAVSASTAFRRSGQQLWRVSALPAPAPAVPPVPRPSCARSPRERAPCCKRAAAVLGGCVIADVL
jgi:hypothetical protein